MEYIEIIGGNKLSGRVRMSGAKNATLPALAATLLAEGTFTLNDVPELEDVKVFLSLLQKLGLRCSDLKKGQVNINCPSKPLCEAPYELVRQMRASILVLGPLVARLGKAKVPHPGGCAIGNRPINLHLKGLKLMGADINISEGFVEATASKLHGAKIYFDITSVTGTENLMMAATLAKGQTVLENAAREPEVVALGRMLMKMGAKIKGLGTETIVIEGVNELKPTTVNIIPDRIEAGTYMMAVGAAGGELTIENCIPRHLSAVLEKLKAAGLKIDIDEDHNSVKVQKTARLKSVDVTTLPYPGFPTDLQAQMMVLMALAEGLSVITETIFENRFMHVDELKRLGADIRIDGRNAIIKGVPKLTGAPVMATDLRASACLILAGLAAEGKTIIHDLTHLDRGYEKMDQKLSRVGANIRRIHS